MTAGENGARQREAGEVRNVRNLLNMLFSSARAKIMPLWIKLRMWTSPAFLRSRVLVKIREFFSNLLDVRPRDRRDYYPILRWLVSKRLAFALVVALGLVSLLYISAMLPDDLLRGNGGVPTYKYRAIPLKFYTGTVNILARDGHVAYSGEVDGGAASGQGTLYAAGGSTVYEGQFENSMYNGQGTLYYPNGVLKYTGGFTDNVYSGTGSSYRPNGVLEYSGGYVAGVRSGNGTLYNSVGSRVFQGSFLGGEIVYHDFLSRPTSEVPELYSGETVVYQSGEEYCVAMPEIDAVYAVKDGSGTLENQWTVDRVYVLHGSVPLESGTCTTLRQLMAAMGEPLYFGAAWVNLPEAAAWNLTAEDRSDQMEQVRIESTATFENVFAVSDYDRDFQMYLYTFQCNGLLYTFYFTGAGESEFMMYALEKA